MPAARVQSHYTPHHTPQQFMTNHVDISIFLNTGTNVRIDEGACTDDGTVVFHTLGTIERACPRWMRSVAANTVLRIVFLQDMRCSASSQKSALLSFFVNNQDIMPYLRTVACIGGVDALNPVVRLDCVSLTDIYAGEELIIGPVNALGDNGFATSDLSSLPVSLLAQ